MTATLALVLLASLPLARPSQRNGGIRESSNEATSAYVSITPVRVLDTRDTVALAAMTPIIVDVSSHVPDGAVAVTANVTIVDAETARWVALWPDGTAWPGVSNVNADRGTIANVTTVTVPANRRIDLMASAHGTHVVVDLQGFYMPSGAATAGRWQPVHPVRVLDTRSTAIVDNSQLQLDLSTWLGGNARAAVLSVTMVDTERPGYVTVWPPGAARPLASNVNTSWTGQTVANSAIVGVTNGKVNVAEEGRGHIVIDLVGYFTSATAPSSTAGLYVPVQPQRTVDTREALGAPLGRQGRFTGRSYPVAGQLVNASGMLFNLTVTNTSHAGYVTAYSGQLPWISSLYVDTPGKTAASQVIVPGNLYANVFATMNADIVADLAGFYSSGNAPGAPIPLPTTTTLQQQPPPGASSTPTANDPNGRWSFLAFAPGGTANAGQAINWDPCAVVRYTVNYNGAPAGARGDVDAAISDIAAATGLTFVNVGDTSYWDSANQMPPAGADLIIGFVDSTGWPGMTSGVLGLGGSAYSYGNGTPAKYTKGRVGINKNYPFQLGLGANRLRSVLNHELGHAFGLGHSSDGTQVMFPVSIQTASPYNTWDLHGLNLLRAGGCSGTSAAGTQEAGNVVIVTAEEHDH